MKAGTFVKKCHYDANNKCVVLGLDTGEEVQ